MLMAIGARAGGALIVLGLVVAVAMNSKSNDLAPGDARGTDTDMAIAQPNAPTPKKIKELHPGESSSKESPKFAPLTNSTNLPSSHKTGLAGSSDPRIGGNSGGTNHEAKKVEGPESEPRRTSASAPRTWPVGRSSRFPPTTARANRAATRTRRKILRPAVRRQRAIPAQVALAATTLRPTAPTASQSRRPGGRFLTRLPSKNRSSN